jgi:predicted nucleic acid-binding protein
MRAKPPLWPPPIVLDEIGDTEHQALRDDRRRREEAIEFLRQLDSGEDNRFDFAMPQAPVTRAACERTIAASRELASERRLPGADYLIAAAAAERGFGVLHYDRHFEPLCRVLSIDSVLIAPRGTLD